MSFTMTPDQQNELLSIINDGLTRRLQRTIGDTDLSDRYQYSKALSNRNTFRSYLVEFRKSNDKLQGTNLANRPEALLNMLTLLMNDLDKTEEK